MINEFRSLFRQQLIVKGLWEPDDYIECDACGDSLSDSLPNTSSVRSRGVRQRETYSRIEHFEDCIKVYQGKNRLSISDKRVKKLEDYLEENYDNVTDITRDDLVQVCK